MTKESTKSTEVALSGNVRTNLKVIEEKLATLAHISASNYKTAMILEPFGNLKEEKLVENLIRAYSSIVGRKEAYDKAAAELGQTTFPQFNLSGGTPEDWKADIKLRIAIIQQDGTIKKLTEYKERMAKFLSEEDQKAILNADIAEFIQSL
jgi:hypothetical protein